MAALVAAMSCQPALAQQGPSGPINVGTLLRQLYGLQNAPNCYRQQLTVGLTATRILPNKASRAAYCIFDPTGFDIWVWFDSTVSTGTGIHISASGGFACFGFRDDMLLPTQALWAMSPTASPTVSEEECDVQ